MDPIILEGIRTAFQFADNHPDFQLNTTRQFYQVNSNYRNPAHNKDEGGDGASDHQYGNAMDFQVELGSNIGQQPYDDLFDDLTDPSRAFWEMMDSRGFALQHEREFNGRVQHIEW